MGSPSDITYRVTPDLPGGLHADAGEVGPQTGGSLQCADGAVVQKDQSYIKDAVAATTTDIHAIYAIHFVLSQTRSMMAGHLLSLPRLE